jgi:LytS/YehU family sensor histidine kinase
MNTKNTRENIIYLIFWIMVFSFPVLLSTGGSRIDWIRVANEIIRIFPFFLVFLVNNFLIFRFFRDKSYARYFISAGITVVAFSFLGSIDPMIYKAFHIPPPPAQGKQDLLRILNAFFYNTIFSILVIGLNNAIKITFDWFREKRNYEELQKENLKNQLALLQHQISPHFLMNTLNNIHALIDYDREIAKDSVVKLSKLMRVLLYENENYTLDKEIIFLRDYIELMKIRVNHDVEIDFDYPEDMPKVNFPPLLFVSFVENSFKHGIMASGKSFIDIRLAIEGNSLLFDIRNSRNVRTHGGSGNEKIGMNNAKKRLDLVYGENYSFESIENDTIYEVIIRIPLDENKVPGH